MVPQRADSSRRAQRKEEGYMRKEVRRGGLSALLAGLLVCTSIAAPIAQAAPDKAADELIETTIPYTQQKSAEHEDGNYFTFSTGEGDWALGESGTEKHVWSRDPVSEADAASIFYEVKFEGSAIDVYSGKNHPMGFARYTVTTASGKTESKEVSLWNDTNIESTKVATFENLGEGQHTLRVEATGKRDERSKTQQECIDCAEVVVKHDPYEPTELKADPASAKLELKETDEAEIKLTVEPDYVSDDDLTYTSKDPKIAEVDDEGNVTAVSEGSTEVVVAPKAKAPAVKAAADGATTADEPQLAEPISIPVTVKSVAPIFGGFISDVDRQWTDDRYKEALPKITDYNDEAVKQEAPAGGAAPTASNADADAPAKAGAAADPVTLPAWKNDAALSQITLVSDETTPIKDVAVTATDFKTDNGATIEAKNVELSFIGSTKAYTGWTGFGNAPGRLPADDGQNRAESNDILLGDDPVDVRKDELQNVFVKVKVPKGAKPGTYKGAVEVTAKGLTEPLKFEYQLEVKDVELPDPSKFENSFDIELWQYPYSSAEYYGVEPFSDEHLKILKPIMEIYKGIGGHAVTTTIVEDAWDGQTYADDSSAGHDQKIHYPSMIKWQMDANGVMRYDFTNFDKWVQFNKDLGMGDKIILYSIAPWHNSVKYWDANGKLQTVANSAVGTPEGNKYWRHFLTALIDHLEEKGWFDDAYIGIDERGFSTDAFDMIDSVKNSKGEPLKTAGAMDDITGANHGMNKEQRFALAMRVDDLNIGDYIPYKADTADAFDELVAKRNNAGLRTTLYSCTEHAPGNFSLSDPVESYWSMINAGKQGTSGFLRWAYDAWVDDPLNDASHWSFEPGDCFLVYPGATKAEVEAGNLTTDQLKARSSVRLERMAEGVRDVNKINLMTSQVTELEAEADKLYDQVKTEGYHDSGHKYLPEDKVKQLDGEIEQFKQGLDTLTDTYVSKVKSGTVKPTGLTVKGGDNPVNVGTTEKFTAETQPADALAKGLTWSSSNPDIANIDADGTLHANKPGVTTITATSTVDGKVAGTKRVVVGGKLDIAPEDKVAHYSFDGNANDDWTGDATTRAAGAGAQNGTVEGDVEFVEGKLGKAAEIDATHNEKITIADGSFSGLDGDKAWTVGYWVKPSELPNSESIALSDATGTWAFALRLGSEADNKNNPGFRVWNPNGNKADVLSFGGSDVFEADKWYRVAWTNDPDAGLTMYVNGEPKGAAPNNWTENGANVANMKFPVEIIGGTGFKGQIDELAVYDRALSKAEVKAQLSEFSPEGEQSGALGLETSEKTIYEGEDFGISGNFDKDVKFEVKATENIADDAKNLDDHDVVTVSEDGVVHGDLRGEAVIKVTSGGKTDEMTVKVKRNVSASNQLTTILVDGEKRDNGEDFVTDVFHPDDYEFDANGVPQRVEGERDGKWDKDKQYFGQPDMLRTKTGRLITAFPQGHGHGPIVMMKSDDGGKNWEPVNTPKSWQTSRETPTLYALDMGNGHERLMLITSCPLWPKDDGQRGWETAYSDDNGDTWTEFNEPNGGTAEDDKGASNWWPEIDGQKNPTVVAMASLVQLHDEKGNPKQEWMGIFHHQVSGETPVFKNFKTILTFEEKDGKMVENWSKPTPLFSERQQKEFEQKLQMCEIGMFRSPDGKRIVGLVRSQNHVPHGGNTAYLSTMIYSDDEGKTWSDPVELPGSLSGERHKALYDPISGRLVITFREMNFDGDGDNKVEGDSGNDPDNEENTTGKKDWDKEDWNCEDWGMWVGTYDQLMNQEDGQYRFRLDEDWVQNAKKGDCGYTGMTVDPETGLFVLDSYGHWDKAYSEGWKGAVTEDLAYIRQARFTLDELLQHFGLETPKLPVNAQVTFDFNFDGAPTAETKTVAAGTQLQSIAPTAPAREGYTFVGWFTDKGATQVQDMNAEVDSNLTLYAGWTENPGGGGGGGKPIDPQEPTDPGKPTDPSKPTGPSKPSGNLPSTGDDVLFYVGGFAVVAFALVVAGVVLMKRRR